MICVSSKLAEDLGLRRLIIRAACYAIEDNIETFKRTEGEHHCRTNLPSIYPYEETWRTEGSHKSSQVQGSFRNYAVDFWYRHFLEGNQEDGLMNKLIDALFDSHDSAKWEQWRETYDTKERSRMKTSLISGKDEDGKRKQKYLAHFTPPSPVFYASKLNLTKLVLRLIEKYRDHLDDMSYFRETALSASCYHGNEPISKTLIAFGANINLATWSGRSPLHTAVLHSHLNLVQLLL